MQLRPAFRLRARIIAALPFSIGRAVSPRPIFVVGCPRSGTTILYRLLATSSQLQDLGQESHWIWELLHRPRRRADRSQKLDAQDITVLSRTLIRAIYRSAFGSKRFVDKCPSNSLRIPAIRAVFPDAVFVAIYRNGPDNVSSLIDTWLDPGEFPGFRVPLQLKIEGYGLNRWVHSLPPGWQAYVEEPIERVCAYQWISTNEALLTGRVSIPPRDWKEVRYEYLYQSPVECARWLLDELDLDPDDSVLQFARCLHRHVMNTRSDPGIGKWRTRHPDRLRRILPMLSPMMYKLGYDLQDTQVH